jgi:small subunit ribosomal protein S4e
LLHFRIVPVNTQKTFTQVRRMQFGKGGIPYIGTHDGRTIRYPDPEVKEQDTVVLDLETGKIREFIKVGVVWVGVGGGFLCD